MDGKAPTEINPQTSLCLRGILAGGKARFWLIDSTAICREAARRHDTSPAVSIALGRLLTAASMMGLMLKSKRESLTIRLEGDGPIGSMTVVAESDGQVRGYAQETEVQFPEIWPGKVDIGFAVGSQGQLTVTKDLGLKEPYQGSVALETGEIGDELSRYFLHSEQTPSAVGLSVLLAADGVVAQAGGYIIQLLPGEQDEQLAIQLEDNLAALHPLSARLAAGETLPEIAGQLFAGLDHQILASYPVSFACNCRRAKLAKVLKGLGRDELNGILADQGEAEVICRFCGERYYFPREEIEQWLSELA